MATKMAPALNKRSWTKYSFLKTMGEITARTPIMKRMLKVLLPITVPSPRPGDPPKTAAKFIENSGTDVPMPTITSPIIHSGIANMRARDVAPFIRILAPLIRK